MLNEFMLIVAASGTVAFFAHEKNQDTVFAISFPIFVVSVLSSLALLSW